MASVDDDDESNTAIETLAVAERRDGDQITNRVITILSLSSRHEVGLLILLSQRLMV